MRSKNSTRALCRRYVSLVLDETTEFGFRAARRLREEIIGWPTTVSPDGAIDALGWTPESFAADFSVPLRIAIARIHGW
jgi:hypothetical protein